jgi:hypothetical protein
MSRSIGSLLAQVLAAGETARINRCRLRRWIEPSDLRAGTAGPAVDTRSCFPQSGLAATFRAHLPCRASPGVSVGGDGGPARAINLLPSRPLSGELTYGRHLNRRIPNYSRYPPIMSR